MRCRDEELCGGEAMWGKTAIGRERGWGHSLYANAYQPDPSGEGCMVCPRGKEDLRSSGVISFFLMHVLFDAPICNIRFEPDDSDLPVPGTN